MVDLIEYQKLAKMRSTYVGKAANFEYKPVKLLKNGGLPKRLDAALKAKGYTYLTDGRITTDSGTMVRPRLRKLDMDGRDEDDVVLTIDLGNGEKLIKKKSGQIMLGTQKPPTGFWQYLRNGEFIYRSR